MTPEPLGNRAFGAVLGGDCNRGKRDFVTILSLVSVVSTFEIIFQEFEQRAGVAAVFRSLVHLVYVEVLSVLAVFAFIAFDFTDENVIFRSGILDKQLPSLL